MKEPQAKQQTEQEVYSQVCSLFFVLLVDRSVNRIAYSFLIGIEVVSQSYHCELNT